ncbi:MAG: hypothetical protein K6F00_01280 [Lachnospiraceae bacterium]|nr:hypothetical protein [Lachnospiraceae bacterium]
MHTEKNNSVGVVEKKEISKDIPDSKNEIQVLEKAEKKEEGISDVKNLLRVVRYPASVGPGVVEKHSIKAWGPAIGLQALIQGFFVLCLYHSMNQRILSALVDLGHSVSKGLVNMSEEMIDFIEKTFIYNIAKIPILGESFSEAADTYLSDYLTLLSTGLSTETNNILYDLYPAINLPVGIGFLMGIVTSLLGVLLSALVIKLFVIITKHPFKSFPEIFSLLAIRSVVTIPMVFVLAILSIFFPMAGVVLMPLVSLFGMTYMFAVLFKSNNEISVNRFVYVFPLIIVLMLLVSAITSMIGGMATGASIGMRVMDFFQSLQ